MLLSLNQQEPHIRKSREQFSTLTLGRTKSEMNVTMRSVPRTLQGWRTPSPEVLSCAVKFQTSEIIPVRQIYAAGLFQNVVILQQNSWFEDKVENLQL